MTLPVSGSAPVVSGDERAHEAPVTTAASMPFPRRVLACLSLSPRAPMVAAEALRLARAANAECHFLHVGKNPEDAQPRLREMMAQAGADADARLILREGKTQPAITQAVRDHGIDLVVAGVLNRQASFRRHVQAVAGQIASTVPCSVLLLTHPEMKPPSLERCVVSVDFDNLSQRMLHSVLPWGRALGIRQWHIVHEYDPRDYYMSRTNAPAESRAARARRLGAFIRPYDWSGLHPHSLCLTNRHGGDAIWYSQVVRADLLCLPLSSRVQRFWERMFTFRLDVDIHALPCALLLYRDDVEAKEEAAINADDLNDEDDADGPERDPRVSGAGQRS